MAMKYCPECGEKLSENSNVCPNCGFVVDSEEKINELKEVSEAEITVSDQTNTTKEIKNQKSKKPIVIVAVILVLIAAIVLGVITMQNNKRRAEEEAAAEAARLEEEQRQKEYEDYVDLFNETYQTIVSNSILTEECGQLIGDVWYNCLWEKDDEETDKYTKHDGEFYDDFNDAFEVLYSDDDFVSKMRSINDTKSEISSNIGLLKNPPDDLSKEHEILEKMYDAHIEFVNCIMNTGGKNYQQYKDDFLEKDANMVSAIDAMDPYVS